MREKLASLLKPFRRDWVVKLLTQLVWATVAGCVVGALVGWGLAQFLHIPQVDQLATFHPASTTRVMTEDGEVLATFAIERRVELKPEEIPQHLKLAIVAIEDADFYRHGGVDPKAIFRAAFYSLKDRRLGSRGGASTLTQQLALNLFLERERSLKRKAKEALLAINIEKRLSKDQILTLYANQIFLGHGAYGVEAASLLYFDKPALELSLSEAALLAGMIPSANNRYDPIRRPDKALARRDKVLRRMLEDGYVDEAAYEAAVAEPLEVSLHRDRVDIGAYFVEMVRRELESRYGSRDLYSAGLQATVTMDLAMQRMAEEAVRDGLVELDMSQGFRPSVNVVSEEMAESPDAYEHPSWRTTELGPGQMARGVVLEVSSREATVNLGKRRGTLALSAARWTGTRSLRRILKAGDLVLVRLPKELPEAEDEVLELALLQEPEIEAALVVLENGSGKVRALVGGFDFGRSQFNCVTQAKRQCGSAFKPFVYLTAFQQGYTLADTLFDAPFLLPDAEGELTYCPKNYYNKYYGRTTLRRALELSFNATAVKLQNLVGGDAVIETARRFGISTPLRPYASLALGSLEVRLIDLVRAYSGIATLGEVPEPMFISEITDRDGKVKDRAFPHSTRVMPAPVVYLMLHALRGVVEHGTGIRASSLDANLAGKTGTTDNYADAWFVGFTPRLTIGVWVGRKDLTEPIGKRMTGARAALPIWMRFMNAFLETLSEEDRKLDFPVPAGVVFSPVDWYTGRRATPSCPRVVLEAFLDGTEPAEACEDKLHELSELPWPYQQPFYVAHPGEVMPSPEALAVADERVLEDEEEEEEEG